jgi:hypothetical protein
VTDWRRRRFGETGAWLCRAVAPATPTAETESRRRIP